MKGAIALTALLALTTATIGSADESHMRLHKKRHSQIAASVKQAEIAQVANTTFATHPDMIKRGAIHNTHGTYYDIPVVGAFGACGWPVFPFGYTVALAQPMYGSLNAVSSFCGQTITVTSGVSGRSHVATIADACPTGGGNCGGEDLDMSKALFEALQGSTVLGKIPITWQLGDADAIASSSRAAAASSSRAAASSRSAARASSLSSAAHASSVSASKASAASSRSAAKEAAESAAAGATPVAGALVTAAPKGPARNVAKLTDLGNGLEALLQKNKHL